MLVGGGGSCGPFKESSFFTNSRLRCIPAKNCGSATDGVFEGMGLVVFASSARFSISTTCPFIGSTLSD